MNKKLILLNNEYYVIDDSEIKDNDYFIDMRDYPYNISDYNIYSAGWGGTKEFANEIGKRITHSTKQLDNVILLNKNDIEEVIYGYNVEKMAENNCKEAKSIDVPYENGLFYGYLAGFNAHKELVKDNFSLEEIEGAFEELAKPKYKFDNQTTFKDMLYMQRKTKWNVEIDDNNKITLL